MKMNFKTLLRVEEDSDMHVLGMHQTSALGRRHTVHRCDSPDNYRLYPDERHGEVFTLGCEVVILHTITL